MKQIGNVKIVDFFPPCFEYFEKIGIILYLFFLKKKKNNIVFYDTSNLYKLLVANVSYEFMTSTFELKRNQTVTIFLSHSNESKIYFSISSIKNLLLTKTSSGQILSELEK